MIRRAYLHSIAPLAAACAALAAPAAGIAAAGTSSPSQGPGSGGAGLSAGGSGSGTTTPAQPANATVRASGDGITVATTESGMLRHAVRFTGTVPASDAGRVVVIERTRPSSPASGAAATTSSSWAVATYATVTSSGGFSAVWRANQAGQVAVKAVLLPPGDTVAPASRRRASSGSASAPAPTGPGTTALDITVYRPAVATFYGPGFWGRRTACGERLRRSTLGVASRSLPCGASVSVLYRGRSITVPVIDRGPYAHGVGWDLTEATAQALGMTGTATIGTIANR